MPTTQSNPQSQQYFNRETNKTQGFPNSVKLAKVTQPIIIKKTFTKYLIAPDAGLGMYVQKVTESKFWPSESLMCHESNPTQREGLKITFETQQVGERGVRIRKKQHDKINELKAIQEASHNGAGCMKEMGVYNNEIQLFFHNSSFHLDCTSL